MTTAQGREETRAAWDQIAPGYDKTRDAYARTWVGSEGDDVWGRTRPTA